MTIPKEELIITRYGVGANSGNLFPNVPFEPKNVRNDFPKFVRGILKAIKNMLSCFSDEEIAQNEILQKLLQIDETFFASLQDEILSFEKLSKVKEIKGKVATYFALGYQGKPVSAYFPEVYENHLQKEEAERIKGYDIITNEEGIGGDANLAFCSVNELPTKMKSIKHRLLPLSFQSAKRVKVGFDVADKLLSHNFYGLKMAILPTLLSDNIGLYEEILKILEKSHKGEIKEIEESESYIDEILEDVAIGEKEYPVLNTILFYQKSNAAVDVLLQIDDVLPSYISHVSSVMAECRIKAFKEEKGSEGILYLQNLFNDRLEIMNVLLSAIKLDKDIVVEKLFQLLYYGNINKKYAYLLDWGKFFNGYYERRSIEAMERYLALLEKLGKINDRLRLIKEFVLEGSKREKIEQLVEGNPFLENDTLKTAYLLGMLAAALSNWQYAIGSDSFTRWLNNFGVISKERLERLWQKEEEMIRKLSSQSHNGNSNVNTIKEVLVAYAPKAFISNEPVKSAYVSLAFAVGGSDFSKYIKEEK